jgi:transposase InsO family protein
VPRRKQERLEHRQGRPSLLAFCGGIEQRHDLVRLRPIDQRGKLVEARLASSSAPNRNASCPIRRCPMIPSKSRWGRWNHGPQVTASTGKHCAQVSGNMKGVGRIYQQTFIATYSKVAFAKLYDRKTPITAADLLNDRVVPFFDEKEVKLSRALTDREYCGNPEHHEYELYLAVEDIDHSRTKTKSPQTNGICERFHKTVLNEFYRIAFRKKLYASIEDLQNDLDLWVRSYNEERPHQGRWCFGKTPMQTFLDATPIAKEKMIAA